MLHYWSLEAVNIVDSWLTIGSFDGVHLGHRSLLDPLSAGARRSGSSSVVLTFYPHPATVLGKRKGPLYLNTPEQRRDLLAQAGIDIVITHPFSRSLASLEAESFMQLVHEHLHPSHLWVGYDFALGKDRKGDVDALRSLGKELGYEVHLAEQMQMNSAPVSSSRIRSALEEGKVDIARQMLGRAYEVTGEVVPGDGRGRTIGIPTANLEIWSAQVLPRPGVYVCQAKLRGHVWDALTNVGYRPTFENRPPVPQVEAHLLDFQGDLYGRQMKLSFIQRLRDEQRFPSIQALVDQIHKDIDQGRKLLGTKQ